MKIDSLKNLYLQNTGEGKSELSLKLFIEYRLFNLDSALAYAKNTSRLSLEDGDSLMYVRGEYATAWTYEHMGLYKIAIDHYMRALETARKNKFREREKSILNGVALAYYWNAQYDKSLEYHFQSLALREQEKNLSEIAISCNNIGLVYYQINDFEKAKNYFERSINIEESLELKGIEGTYINLGLCLAAMGEHDRAIEKYERALDICEEKKCRSKVLIEAYTAAGVSYFNQGKNDFAELYYSKALANLGSDGLEANAIVTFYNWAELKLKEGNINEALELLNKGHQLAKKIGNRKWEAQNFHLYAEIYSILGDYHQAYYYQKKYDSLNKTILNEVIAKNLLNIQLNFEERQNLETINLQRSELTRRTTLLILSVVIIILAVIILVILYKNNQHRRKVNNELSEANDIIEEQNHELMNMNNVLEEKVRERTRELNASNAALLKSNTELDNFIYKTSHDIRGPLATLQGVCNVALMDIKDKQAIDYFQKLGKTAARLNEILSKLLVINQINNSLISQERIDFDGLISEQLNGQGGVKTAKQIEVKQEIQSGLDFRSDSELLKIILKNLINNAFKFHNTSSRVHSFVYVTISRCKNDLAILITDNGIGIDENVSSKIFEIFSKASDIADTAGLGLYLVKLAVEKLRGEINLTKTQCGHTQFEVRLPYK